MTSQIEQIITEAEEIAVEQVETYGRYVERLRASPATPSQQAFVARLEGYLANAEASLAEIRTGRSQNVTECNNS